MQTIGISQSADSRFQTLADRTTTTKSRRVNAGRSRIGALHATATIANSRRRGTTTTTGVQLTNEAMRANIEATIRVTTTIIRSMKIVALSSANSSRRASATHVTRTKATKKAAMRATPRPRLSCGLRRFC